MEYVNTIVLGSMVLNIRRLNVECTELDRIWRYLFCIQLYDIKTIVIGQNSYEPHMMPMMASAFSQSSDTPDTPSTRLFSTHFDNSEISKSFIRSTWTLLPRGIAFVNADYLPSSLGGGSRDPDCILRVYQMVEFLFYCLVSRDVKCSKLTIMCAGNLANFCGNALARRLRALGMPVEQKNFKQPASLAKISFNKTLIGKDPRYLFCEGSTLSVFHKMIDIYRLVQNTKERDILLIATSRMSESKVMPMTKKALENILSECLAIQHGLNVTLNTPKTASEMASSLNSLSNSVRDLTVVVHSLTTLLLGDAYTYKTIVESESLQVPVASREQHGPVVRDSSSMVASEVSSIPSRVSNSSSKPTPSKSRANMFVYVKKSTPSSQVKSPPPSGIKVEQSNPSSSAKKSLDKEFLNSESTNLKTSSSNSKRRDESTVQVSNKIHSDLFEP